MVIARWYVLGTFGGAKRGWWTGGNRERGSYSTSTQSKRERNRALVRCGVTVWCSALWECVEVQWCCHGDKLRRSVLEVGVTECKLAYPTSTLIFTARATRHLTRGRCLRATPTLSWQRGPHAKEAVSRSGERLGDFKHGRKRRAGFSSASAVRVFVWGWDGRMRR